MSDLSLSIRNDFPILQRQLGENKLIYLDNAATTQKPKKVIDAIADYYAKSNSNVHRGVHQLADEATQLLELSRTKVKNFIHANHEEEVIFTRGTTESINLVANCMETALGKGDEILISELEHHANIVPWQLLAKKTEAKLAVCKITDNGEIDFDDFRRKLGKQTKLVAISHVSNALGTVLPLKKIVELSHKEGALVLVDGAQAALHIEIDVRAIGCDFYAFSGHKLLGPTGIGILYGRKKLLEQFPPWQAGGEMIEHVSFKETIFNKLPYKFEAGTPNIAGIVGLGAAIDYIQSITRNQLYEAESALVEFCLTELRKIKGIRIVGDPAERVSIISFLLEGAHPQDVGMILDQQGIAVRTGHHCAMPLMERLGLPGTVRASFSLYNTMDDATSLVKGIEKVRSFI